MATAPSKPNVIWIMADDMGYGDLSCYGATRIQTPHMDRVAAEGMRFSRSEAPAWERSICEAPASLQAPKRELRRSSVPKRELGNQREKRHRGRGQWKWGEDRLKAGLRTRLRRTERVGGGLPPPCGGW